MLTKIEEWYEDHRGDRLYCAPSPDEPRAGLYKVWCLSTQLEGLWFRSCHKEPLVSPYAEDRSFDLHVRDKLKRGLGLHIVESTMEKASV